MQTGAVLFESLALSDLRRMGRPVPPAITVLLPAYVPGALERPNSLRIRSAVDSIFPRLLTLGLAHHEIAHMVAPLLALTSDPSFRHGRRSGVALFLDCREFFCFDVPGDVEELVSVGRHFHIRPLLGWLSEPRDFLILELTRSKARLVRCRDGKLTDVGMPGGAPEDMQAMNFTEAPEPGRGGRPGSNRARSQTPAIQFGLTSANEERRIRFFCAMVDRGLQVCLQDMGLPLVVAGSERIVNAYQSENTYARMVADTLKANLDTLPEDEVIAHARRLIHQERMHEATRHLVEMEEYAPGDRWSTSIDAILRGAANGRVWRLFLSENATCIGDVFQTLGRSCGTTSIQEDLLNAAAIETLIQGGEVFLVDPEILPPQAPAAALFRYSLGPNVREC
jgi:hypothetical protein